MGLIFQITTNTGTRPRTRRKTAASWEGSEAAGGGGGGFQHGDADMENDDE